MARNWTAVDVSVVMGRKPMASPLKRQTGKGSSSNYFLVGDLEHEF
jgi:hypothetical protein